MHMSSRGLSATPCLLPSPFRQVRSLCDMDAGDVEGTRLAVRVLPVALYCFGPNKKGVKESHPTIVLNHG